MDSRATWAVMFVLALLTGCVDDGGTSDGGEVDAADVLSDAPDVASDASDGDAGVDADASTDADSDADAAADAATDVPWYIGEPCTANARDGECLHVDDCGGSRESVPGHCPGPAPIQSCVEEGSS